MSNCQYQVTLDAEKEYLMVGSNPRYRCGVNQNANFLIRNPLRWEKRRRDGSILLISILANVEPGVTTRHIYYVQLDTTDHWMYFTLSFLSGM